MIPNRVFLRGLNSERFSLQIRDKEKNCLLKNIANNLAHNNIIM
jgi:hypothetical protein